MRLRMTEGRERRLEHLKEALEENTKSKALDKAAEYTLRMRGNSTAIPVGAVAELMRLADDQGSVTAAEIAEVLDTPQVPVQYKSRWSIGPREDSASE